MDINSQIPDLPIDDFKDITGDIPADEKIQYVEPGERIRSIRMEKEISIETLSQLTGYDEDFLEGIENKTIQPQLGTLIRLSKALDSAVGRLISRQGEKLYSIVRKGEHVRTQRSTSGKGKRPAYQYSSLGSDVQGRHMESFMVELKQNNEKELSSHEGEEFIHVLKGDVICKIGTENLLLKPGDSIYYLSTTPHQLTAKDETASVLATIYEG